MASRADLKAIRIINVTNRGRIVGLNSLKDMLSCLPAHGFVAIDAEFSGMGSDPDRLSENLRTRYAAIRRMANTRAILSVGISIFIPVIANSDETSGKQTPHTPCSSRQAYKVATFDFLMRCESDFHTNAGSCQFLVRHGFSFDRMYQKGIPYMRASNWRFATNKGKNIAKGRNISKGKNTITGKSNAGECEKEADNVISSKNNNNGRSASKSNIISTGNSSTGRKDEKEGEKASKGKVIGKGKNTGKGKNPVSDKHPADRTGDKEGRNVYNSKNVKGPRDAEERVHKWRPYKMLRDLLSQIGQVGVPLILHNGIHDLAFLFAAFHGPLPRTLSGFTSALLKCVPGGYWDTKVLASAAMERVSILEHLFARAVLKDSVAVQNCHGLPDDAITDPAENMSFPSASNVLCPVYSLKGICHRAGCPFAHDAFLLAEEEGSGSLPKTAMEANKKHNKLYRDLRTHHSSSSGDSDNQPYKQRKNVTREHVHTNVDPTDPKPHRSAVLNDQQTQPPQTGDDSTACDNDKKFHTSGWDAFCTGYVFAAYLVSISPGELATHRNTIALAGKPNGLLLSEAQGEQLRGILEG